MTDTPGSAASESTQGSTDTVVPPGFDLLEEVRVFLSTSRTAAVATVDEDGLPHVVNVQYAVGEGLTLYFVSAPAAAHSQHIERAGTVALAAYAHDDRASNIHGVQMHAKAEAITDPGEANLAFEVYTGRFTFAAALPQFRKVVESQTFYRVTPTWIRWIDNRRGFGWKVEQTL